MVCRGDDTRAVRLIGDLGFLPMDGYRLQRCTDAVPSLHPALLQRLPTLCLLAARSLAATSQVSCPPELPWADKGRVVWSRQSSLNDDHFPLQASVLSALGCWRWKERFRPLMCVVVLSYLGGMELMFLCDQLHVGGGVSLSWSLC